MTTYDELMGGFTDEQWDTFESRLISINLGAFYQFIVAMQAVVANDIIGLGFIWKDRIEDAENRLMVECQKILEEG